MGLALDLATCLDPCLLGEQMGLPLDDWQQRVLRSNAKRVLLNVHRQGGKSSVTSILATHTALYQAASLTLILSPSERQSKETFAKVMACYRAAGKPVDPESETTLWLELENGSRVVALPGSQKTVRGFSGVALLIVDEAAQVDDALYHAVRPMLAVSGGRLVLLSTPWGKRGFFHKEWTEGGPSWQRVEVNVYQCPRIPADFIEEERRSLPRHVFDSEYGCQFTETEDAVFAYADIHAAPSADVTPLFALDTWSTWGATS